MPAIDDEIDRLFQGPLAEFVTARNALAKMAGTEAAGIKALQKPNVPAWAVNQLYWKKRRVFDRLASASLDVRSAYGALFASRPADVQKADAAHREAQAAAMEEIKAILRGAGESGTPATLTAVRETLQALPAGGTPGRLTRPLKPQGFEALRGMTIDDRTRSHPAGAPVHQANATAPTRGTRAHAPERLDAAAREQAEARRREILTLERELKDARANEQTEADAVVETRASIEAATAERKRLQDALTVSVDRLHALSTAAAAHEKTRQTAARVRQSLEDRLSRLKEES